MPPEGAVVYDAPMKLSDMTDVEQSALGNLVRLMLRLHTEAASEESDVLREAAAELGEDEFWELMRQANLEQRTEDRVREQAAAIERKDVQERIYGLLFSIAVTGSIIPQESELLKWLSTTWELETSVEEPGASSDQGA